MKKILLGITTCCLFFAAKAQLDGPKEITPAVLAQFKKEAATEAMGFKASLNKEDMSADAIEFAADTFMIERIIQKRMDVDYSTVGMNITVDEATKSYDALLNKYYNKILKLLKPEDKKILISAQKAWLFYRDAEKKLMGMLTKEEYSGGGTIQSNIFTGNYNTLVRERAEKIFQYYDEMEKIVNN